ncbi:MAG TPA: hypothetical protein VF297_17085 [Pyrinomonadaceae bacterium]
MPKALRWIIYLTIFLLVFFLIAYTALSVGSIYDEDAQRKQVLGQVAVQIAAIGVNGWSFIRPFLQLILVLVIIDWMLSRWGVNLQSKVLDFDWNIQTLIALIIIGAFAVAALGGINDGIGTLKDLALVVVGFYFGSQKRSIEIETEKGKETIVEEHHNDLTVKSTEGKKEGEEGS